MTEPFRPDDLELRSLQQQIHDRLLGRILRGELQPGAKISPPEIADLPGYLQEMATDADFHMAIVRAAGNRRLDAVYGALRTRVLVARITFPRLYRHQPHRRGEHRRVP